LKKIFAGRNDEEMLGRKMMTSDFLKTRGHGVFLVESALQQIRQTVRGHGGENGDDEKNYSGLHYKILLISAELDCRAVDSREFRLAQLKF
jgi:hypothetical protein